MPEYVYALHDFVPENEDEIPFRAGDRIEVLEKDEEFGDGWWQGRNLAGRSGLFPQSYTAPAPPASGSAASTSSRPSSSTTNDELAVPASSHESEDRTPTASEFKPPPNEGPSSLSLQPLREESERGSSAGASPVQPDPRFTNGPAIYVNGEETQSETEQGPVMKQTMTDVQKAIEQLGRSRSAEDTDGARSFSYASSRGDTDSEFDLSDADGHDGDHEEDGEGWHKSARRKLAEKARRAVEEAEKLEMIMNGSRSAPPIDVEVSDESESEDDRDDERDFTRTSGFTSLRRHSNIMEEDEETEGHSETEKSRAADEDTSVEQSVPLPSDTTLNTQSSSTTLHRSLSPTSQKSPPTPELAPKRSSLPTPVSTSASLFPHTQARDSSGPLPSPTTSSAGVGQSHLPTAPPSKHSSVASAPDREHGASPSAPAEKKEGEKKANPSEWTVEEVLDWLRSKGFGTDVCEKFTEQEITGDVLLQLDVNLLKTEIGIMAFGKRMRIANAITDLRRPPSIVYSDHPDLGALSSPSSHPLSPHSPAVVAFPQSPTSLTHAPTHSRTQSMNQSHHSYPGTIHSAGNAAGMSVSASSPMMRPSSVMNGEPPQEMYLDAKGGLGAKRPSQLALSPSATNLGPELEGLDEDRGAMSENELTSPKQRRRIFGRSHDSAGSTGKDKDTISPVSAQSVDSKDSEKDSASTRKHARARRSVDTGRGSGERLSIFGGFSAGTFGKSRKPPPRYSAGSDEVVEKEKLPHSNSGFLRFSSTGSKKSQRPSTSDGYEKGSTTKDKVQGKLAAMAPSTEIPRVKSKEPKERATSPSSPKPSSAGSTRSPRQSAKEPQLLRKRTSSHPGTPGDLGQKKPATDPAAVVSPLKPGTSILDQIGDPDFSGWMRKKGERYNSWKTRYFVLQGPHLYWMRSDSRSETKIKGYINVVGYKVSMDEGINPGKYNFRIDHEKDRTHFFSSDDKTTIRDWMKAIMKATIDRDFTKPVMSSVNIPTIPLLVAQAMNPAPRPPSPTARDATQKALRRANPNQLSTRDARILMGLPSNEDIKNDKERSRLDSFFTNETVDSQSTVSVPAPSSNTSKSSVPPRPSREGRRMSSSTIATSVPAVDQNLIDWANSHLPEHLQVTDTSSGSIFGGLALLRLAEEIKGQPSSPPVPDSMFPTDPDDDKIDGLFRLFDFLLDNDVKMGSLSINDIRQGKQDKVVQLLRALKVWEDKRKAIAQSIGKGGVQVGAFAAPIGAMSWPAPQ